MTRHLNTGRTIPASPNLKVNNQKDWQISTSDKLITDVKYTKQKAKMACMDNLKDN